ncbi:protein of unknown function DUF1713 [Macleaya cordata]|uniref:Small ribosomal subunit protein mS38 n=1 Tax=Macleaya cordata TaxID=56857 RepID=A0A200RCV6_MACCD|nr:protein of unknown function DUF1713 [Macleaya cordata]
MAGVLQKLLRKASPVRIITNFNNPLPPNISVPLILHQPHPIDFKPNDPITDLNPILGSPNCDKNALNRSQQIYPSFPFGYYLNPISQTGISITEQDEEVNGSGKDEKTVWADSVKKKRKKKMNKHKYRKLRKRLRRQT